MLGQVLRAQGSGWSMNCCASATYSWAIKRFLNGGTERSVRKMVGETRPFDRDQLARKR